ncbi:hypothetical protein EB796_004767 [Bugula neritina]|uniref:Nose resistant-to-fluoxetine protein N-terminal domain-containing protein n=1 Tax=Bugula neritina TaxID=10212 RepID=A0A7J7KFE0_BUGNE|nr:hypothetical protein EB796_004767 [Bugula neritina]
MVPSVYALGAIMAMVAGIIQADSSTYVRPEKALHELQQLRRASDRLSSSDIDRITSVGESLSPLKVFQVITETSGDVSDTCFNQTLYVLESIVNGGKEKTWALQLIDSWGKPGAGITQLNINWLGDFDECMGVKSYYNTSIGPTDPYSYMPHSFVGRYCGLGAVVGPPTVGLGIPVGINVGSCFPSGCTDTDISTIVTLVLRGAGLNVTEDVNVGCQERELPYSTGAIVTIVVYCVMGAMCLLATLYDFVHNTEAPQTMLSTEENGAAASKSDHSVSVMSSDADLTTSAARSDSGEMPMETAVELVKTLRYS